jgi:hypothetical protein
MMEDVTFYLCSPATLDFFIAKTSKSTKNSKIYFSLTQISQKNTQMVQGSWLLAFTFSNHVS